VLSRSGQVRIEIFNILGQRVRVLVDQYLKAGHKLVDWDGCDDSDKEVSSGIYFYRIEADEFSQTKKMILLR
jgi:flagellar hook assembly protein FlgD